MFYALPLAYGTYEVKKLSSASWREDASVMDYYFSISGVAGGACWPIPPE
jgi:hypothetical protein